MIPRAYITEWRRHAPWSDDAWVEQDLVISRAIVEIFRVDALAERLAFRGGTALYKLHLSPAARYSEDIDLVQVRPEAIGDTFDGVRAVLDPWLGEPRRQLTEGGAGQPRVPLRQSVQRIDGSQFGRGRHKERGLDGQGAIACKTS